MRILIDPSSHHLMNMGDVAMLQACVGRLGGLWPGARFDVITEAPALLERFCPGAHPVPGEGRRWWLRQPQAEAPPGAGRRATLAAWRARAPQGRAAFRGLLRAQRRRFAGGPLADYIDALLSADLVVVSGRGGITDAFRDESFALLAEIEAATAAGKPVALLGQGIGPIAAPELFARARQVLPKVLIVTLREGRDGPGLLGRLGVPPGRTLVTGDDALALVPTRDSRHGRQAVGLSLRSADYSGLDRAAARRLVFDVARTAERLGAELAPVAMSTHPHEADIEALAATGVDVGVPETPDQAIQMISDCRAVVAGSYHAALFALSQGIPAICPWRTPYYRSKMFGLRERFGRWCRPVEIGDGWGAPIEDALLRAWEEADAAAPELIAAMRGQRAAADRAYERMAEQMSGYPDGPQ